MSDKKSTAPVEPAKISTKDLQTLLNLYTTFLNSVSNNEQRRQQATQIYMALISALIAFCADANDSIAVDTAALWISIIAIVWYLTIRYHRALARAKFKVVDEFEQQFPYRPFDREWEVFRSERAKVKFPTVELTQIEMALPIVVAFFAVALIAYRNYEKIINIFQ